MPGSQGAQGPRGPQGLPGSNGAIIIETIPVPGAPQQVLTADGVGGVLPAPNLFAGDSFVAHGVDPAPFGGERYPTKFGPVLVFMDPTNTFPMIGTTIDSAGNLVIGSNEAPAWANPVFNVFLNALASVAIRNQGNAIVSFNATDIESFKPRLGGLDLPYASEGRATKDLTGLAIYTIGVEASLRGWRFTGAVAAGGCVVTVPTPVGEGGTYYPVVDVFDVTGNVTLTIGSGDTLTLIGSGGVGSRQPYEIQVTPDGIYHLQ